jgi:hypothetical protein
VTYSVKEFLDAIGEIRYSPDAPHPDAPIMLTIAGHGSYGIDMVTVHPAHATVCILTEPYSVGERKAGRMTRFSNWFRGWCITLNIMIFDRKLYKQLTQPLDGEDFGEVTEP